MTSHPCRALALGAALLLGWGCSRVPAPTITPALPDFGLEAADATVSPGAISVAATGQLELHFVDIGQGDATLVICPNGQRILVDAGSKGGKTSAERAAIRSEIRGLVGPGIDSVVITHGDGDHFNMLADTLDGLPVRQVVMGGHLNQYSASFRNNWLNEFANAGRLVQPGDAHSDPESTPSSHFNCGDARIWILAANVPTAGVGEEKNTQSIVLRIEFGDFEAILGGDFTFETEDHILETYTDGFLDVDVLKLGHHGSRVTSTALGFARTVKPERAIASTSGENFGHPSWAPFDRVVRHTLDLADTHRIRRCARTSACNDDLTDEAIYSTFNAGTIAVVSTGTGYSLSCALANGC